MWGKTSLFALALAAAAANAGELELLWPCDGAEVQLLSKAQKEYLQRPLAERTKDFADAGTLAFLLEALLGVDDEELNRDWECSGFTNPGAWFCHEKLFNQIYKVLEPYPGANTREKVEAYLRDCGLVDADFAFLRGMLLK